MLASRILPFVLLVVFTSYSINTAYSEESLETLTVTITVDKADYHVGESLVISGNVSEKKMPVIAVRVFDPNDQIISANSLGIEEDGTFSKTVFLDSAFFEKPGSYKITTNYGKLKDETSFEIIGEAQNQEILSQPEEILPDIPVEITGIVTDKAIYHDGDTIKISGSVSKIEQPTVVIDIRDPFGTPTGFYFGAVDVDKNFSVNLLVKAGVNFKKDGTYSIFAHYAKSKETINFEFSALENTEPTKPTVEEPKIDIVQENIEKTPESGVQDLPTLEETEEEILITTLPSDESTVVEEIHVPPSITNTPVPEKTENNPISIDKKEISKPKIIETEILVEEEKTNQKLPKQVLEQDNLSVEDAELGQILNRIKLNCDNDEVSDIISYDDSMGPALMRLCKYQEAVDYYDSSLAKNSYNVEILTNKGSALRKMGFYQEAMTYYTSALSVNPEYVPALNNQANVLMKLGSVDEAFEIYSKAKEIDPQNAVLNENFEKARISSYIQSIDSEIPENNEPENLVSAPVDESQVLQKNSFLTTEKNQQGVFHNIEILISSLGSKIFSLFS